MAFNMALSNQDTLSFIENYKAFPCLWDTKNNNYNNKMKRIEALKSLGKKYSMDVITVKKKIKSLRSYFSREHQRMLTKNCVPSWFAYDSMSFIYDPIEIKKEEEVVESETSTNDTFNEEHIEEDEIPIPTSNHYQQINKKRKAIEFYNCYKKSEDVIPQRDEASIFGEMIATKLRKLSSRNQIIAQHHINNYLFDMEMEELNFSSSIPPPTSDSNISSNAPLLIPVSTSTNFEAS